MSNKYAFTLVELIVVVTILAILATIGFVSYSGYLTGVRDTNRIASLTSISDGLELYRTRNDLPDPDEAIDIQVEGVDIAHQGYVGSNVLQTIEYSKAGKDPKDDSYYSYYLTDDKKYYQLMAFLEESDNLDTHNITSTSHAASDYKNRYPKVYGKRLGILTDMNNAPVQEVITGTLNFTGGTTSAYRARFTDSEIIEGSGSMLKSISPVASCKRIKQLKGGARDGVYSINPTGTGAFDVYCDMTRNGGGWMMVLSVYGADMAKLTDKNLTIVKENTSGSHINNQQIFDITTEFRWTDTNNIRFLQGETDMSTWWSKITTQNCNTGGNTIDVSFENGWLNTSTLTRKVEACVNYHFGMRNNHSYSNISDITEYNNSGTHMCWYDIDINISDRPFKNSISHPGYCDQFNYNFDSTAARGGTMNYYIWVR